MNVELKLSTDQDAHIIKNLWPLYQHDVSEFDASKPNRHGLFGVDNSVITLAEHSESLDAWWKDPQSLFPYLILINGCPAGFNLVAARSRLPESIQHGVGAAEKRVLIDFTAICRRTTSLSA